MTLKNRIAVIVILAALAGCSGYSSPNERGEVAHGVVVQGQTTHQSRVLEQQKVLDAQAKTLERQKRELMDVKRQEEQNQRLKRYGAERDLSTFEGY